MFSYLLYSRSESMKFSGSNLKQQILLKIAKVKNNQIARLFVVLKNI